MSTKRTSDLMRALGGDELTRGQRDAARAVIAARRQRMVNEAGHVIGQDHHRAKLKDHDVWLIRQLRAQRVPCKVIAAQFGVSWHTVKAIGEGRRRAHMAT